MPSNKPSRIEEILLFSKYRYFKFFKPPNVLEFLNNSNELPFKSLAKHWLISNTVMNRLVELKKSYHIDVIL